MKIQYKTKGNSTPHGKPRIFFTCHPDDFDKYFDRISNDIFKTHECAIYHTDNFTETIDEDDKNIILESNNLFVIPVTFKLLTEPNRAMSLDIAYAKEHHIPILPFMMESGIDEFYSRPENFGEIQYLSPFSTDSTEISYEEKLKKYLDVILIGDEMASRVRDAFDAYIFLSYRKKDRKYANELMRIIHSKKQYRDIAIWYDEFLTPGESFKENIEKILKNSKLFALLVTPNLLEEPNGNPNYVMGEEYPVACKKGIDILPAEMVQTDKDKLSAKFKNIPLCVNPYDDAEFVSRLSASLSELAKEENNNPEHNFLIGLAYLDGIDVEVNRTRGLSLIESAAEEDLPEAMEKLYDMYSKGICVELNYQKALAWLKRLVDFCISNLGEEDPTTLLMLDELGGFYCTMERSETAIETLTKVFNIREKNSEQNTPILCAQLEIWRPLML